VSVPGRQSIGVFAEEIQVLSREGGELPAASAKLLSEFMTLFCGSIEHEWTAYTLGNVIDSFAGALELVELARSSDYSVSWRQPILMFQRTSRLIQQQNVLPKRSQCLFGIRGA
jgi:hypothetical protein